MGNAQSMIRQASLKYFRRGRIGAPRNDGSDFNAYFVNFSSRDLDQHRHYAARGGLDVYAASEPDAAAEELDRMRAAVKRRDEQGALAWAALSGPPGSWIATILWSHVRSGGPMGSTHPHAYG